MITLNDLSVSFGTMRSFSKKKVLDSVSYRFETGVYGLLGQNGAGKTTMIRCIAGHYQTKPGIVQIKEDARIGYLPQQFGSFKQLNCTEMLEYYCCIKKLPKAEHKKAISEALEFVNLSGEAKKRIGALSGGMLRRLGLAQALLGRPDVLLLDEPTAGLDPEERIRFKAVIEGLSGEMLILLSTHIIGDMENLCNPILILHQGKLRFAGTQDELREKAATLKLESTLENGFMATIKGEAVS